MAVRSVKYLLDSLFLTGHSGSVTQTLTAATGEMVAWSFIAPTNPLSGAMTLSNVRIYLSAATGSPKATAYLYSDLPGEPNAAVANGTGVESGVLSTGWNTLSWGGTLPALTEGVQYWVVVKCTSGTSLQVGVRGFASSGYIPAFTGFGNNTAGWRGLWDVSTDGSTWNGTARNAISCIRMCITDGTDTAYFMNGMMSYTTTASSNKIGSSSMEEGIYFTIPSVPLTIKAIGLCIRRVGNPGAATLNVYLGDSTTATATSNAIPAANISTGGDWPLTFSFSSSVAFVANTKYRVTICAASGDTSNYYYTYNHDWDTDSAAGGTVDLRPWACGSCYRSGGAWTDSIKPNNSISMYPDITSYGVAAYPSDAPNILTGQTVGGVAGSLTPDYPAVGNVLTSDTVNGVAGTFDEAARNTDPGEANVKTGTAYLIQNTAKNGSYAASSGVAGSSNITIGWGM